MPTTETFDTVGAHDWTVPAGVSTVTARIWGAEGGESNSNYLSYTSVGGEGGYVEIEFSVTEGETLELRVGGAGSQLSGGYNGGADASELFNWEGGGGGGASDIRQGGTALADRLAVAAGGGGGGIGGAHSAQDDGVGGAGGAATGADGADIFDNEGGAGGSQSSGGAGGTTAFGCDGDGGSLGDGGDGCLFSDGSQDDTASAGGGGGGYYGGGGGGVRVTESGGTGGGGGGGSNYVGGAGTVLSNSRGGSSGDGQIVLEYETPPGKVENLTATADASLPEIDLAWDSVADATDYNVYRDTDPNVDTSGPTNRIATTSSTSYTDSGLSEGQTYYYRVRATNAVGEGESSEEASATTPLPAPTLDAFTAVSNDDIDATWTLHSSDETSVRLEASTDGGGSWSTAATLPAGATSTTWSGALDGQEYVGRVVAVTDDTESASGASAPTTTDLPDEDQPVLGNGVKDEIEVDRETASSDNGSVRYQLRRSEDAPEWEQADSFQQFIGANDTLVFEFVGLLDGEEYEVRGRTETDDVTGAWTEPQAIVTKFPGAADLQVTATAETTVALSWTDNADNEDGQYVVRERRSPDGVSWWPEEILTDVGVDTESYTDETPQPDTEYRYRIRPYTAYTSADSDPATATTDSVEGIGRIRIPPDDIKVEIEDADGKTLEPTLLDAPEWIPATNALPEISIPVPADGADRWKALEGQPMRVWWDGKQLPIGEYHAYTERPDRLVIEGRGATQLETFVDSIQWDARENHLAAGDLLEQETNYQTAIDDPAADTRPDVTMLSRRRPDLDEAFQSFSDDVPVRYRTLDGALELLQSGWFVEGEDAAGNYVTEFADQRSISGEWSGDAAARLDTAGQYIEWEADPQYLIPENDLEVSLLNAVIGDNPELEFSIDGTVVETFPEGGMSESADVFDLSWDSRFGNDPAIGDLEAGEPVAVRVEATSTPSDGEILIDAAVALDDRFEYLFDADPVDGVIDGPQPYPIVTLETVDVSSVEQVIGGGITVSIDNTDGDQRLRLSNDQGQTWEIVGENTDTVEGEFAEAGVSIRGEVQLSRNGERQMSPALGYEGQVLDEITITADLDDTPLLLDKREDGPVREILNRIAEQGNMLWEARRDPDADPTDPDGYIIEWTQARQREQTSQQSLADWQIKETTDDSYDRVIVFGDSRRVEAHEFTANAPGLREFVPDDYLKPASERVYDPANPDTEFERRSDYLVEWATGGIEITDAGDMIEGETYAIDCEWRFRGEASTPGVDDPDTLREEIPDAVSSLECEQLALGILKRVQEPRKEVTATMSTDDPTRSVVAALSHPDLPIEGPLVVRDRSHDPGEVQYRFETRRTPDEILDELRDRLDAVSRAV